MPFYFSVALCTVAAASGAVDQVLQHNRGDHNEDDNNDHVAIDVTSTVPAATYVVAARSVPAVVLVVIFLVLFLDENLFSV